jgi:uncharacterized membrane protein
VPGGWLALAGPFLIVIAAAVLVYVQWDTIPDQFASMQRGSRGRLVPRSVRAVFGPFAFTSALLVAFTMQTVFLLKRTRQIASGGPASEAEYRFKRRTALQSIVATYLMAIGPSWFATQRVLGGGTGTERGWALWVGVIAVLTIAVVVWMVRVGQGGQRQVPPSAGTLPGDATPDRAWKGGLIYVNPSDPAVFVEKRLGVGWTLNLGNVWSWVFLAFALGVPMLVLRLMR